MNRLTSFAIALLCLTFVSCTTARGEKLGTITKLAQQGAFCPTWEGQIIRGGISGGTGAFGAPFDFTIKNEDGVLVEQIRTFMEAGTEVKLYYTSYFPVNCSSDSGHFVYRVEPVRGQSR